MTVQRIPITSREAWLNLRRADITASDVPAICGVDPRRTALQVYAEKLGLIAEPVDDQLMRRGRWLESAFIEALADLQPSWETRRSKVYLRDDTIRIGATPDIVAVDPEREGIGNIQCKVVSRPVFVRDWCDDGEAPVTVPLGYQLQTLTESMLAGATWAVVAALVIDTFTADLVINPIDLHIGAWDRIRATVSKFWTDVTLGRQPRADYERDADTIAELYPQADGDALDLTGDNLLPPLLAERKLLKEEIATREKRVGAIDTELKAKLGAAPEAILRDWKITWKMRAGYVANVAPARVIRVKELNPRAGEVP